MEDVLLATKSFDLMEVKHKDAGTLFSKLMRCEEILKCCPWETHRAVEDTHNFLNSEKQLSENGGYFAWGMYLDDFSFGKNRPRLFGYATLKHDEDAGASSIFVAVCAAEQRKGYAEEALCAIANFAFSRLNCKIVTSAVPYFNTAGRNLLEKVGFVQQYQFTSTWRGKEGTTMLRYNYTRAQYEAE